MKTMFAVFFALCICPFSLTKLHADHGSSKTPDIVTTAAQNGSFNTLVSLLVATGLDDALSSDGSFTVFAPNDDAFAKLSPATLADLRRPENVDKLAGILKYHVVGKKLNVPKRRPSHPLRSIETLLGPEIQFKREGDTLRVNESTVVARNIRCSNGNIQVIDSVLLPPEPNSIVDVAAKAGNFKTLLAAAEAAGLVDALSGSGPLTVFAPTDEAFAKLPSGTIKNLLKPENKAQLASILKYHVVSGDVSAADAIKAAKATTLDGRKVSFSIRDGRLRVNESVVIANDISAENGIIHIIDQVLIPTAEKSVTIRSTWDRPVNRNGIEADELILYCSGGGSIQLTNVSAKKVITRISGGGSVSLSGNTDQHVAQVNGGARLTARDLKTQQTKINVNGGGRAIVNAQHLLDVSARGGANVRYVKTNAKIVKNINRYADFAELH